MHRTQIHLPLATSPDIAATSMDINPLSEPNPESWRQMAEFTDVFPSGGIARRIFGRLSSNSDTRLLKA
jgi:hypothetical protein